MDDEEQDAPVSNYFSRRAKFVPKISAEGFKAASELINEIKRERVSSERQKSQDLYAPASKTNSKKKKVVTDIDEFLAEEDVIEESVSLPSISEIELSSSAKRRLKKFELERRQELLRIRADNEKVLAAINADVIDITDVEAAVDDDFDELTVLTISFVSEISRIKCYKNEKFSAIFPRIAELLKLKVSEFLLCHKENNISVDDTPESLNLGACDILDCIPYKADENMEINYEYDDNRLKLFFQTSYDKEKIHLVVHKLEKMENVMEQYSKLQDIPVNEFTFEFDGERIMGTETAEDLDMETGHCIDVIVFNPSRKMTSSKKRAAASIDNCAVTSSVNSAAALSVYSATNLSVNSSASTLSVNSTSDLSVISVSDSSVSSASNLLLNSAANLPVSSTSSSPVNKTATLAKKRATRSHTPSSIEKCATRSHIASSTKKPTTRSRTTPSVSAKKPAPTKSKKQAPAPSGRSSWKKK